MRGAAYGAILIDIIGSGIRNGSAGAGMPHVAPVADRLAGEQVRFVASVSEGNGGADEGLHDAVDVAVSLEAVVCDDSVLVSEFFPERQIVELEDKGACGGAVQLYVGHSVELVEDPLNVVAVRPRGLSDV